MDCPPPSSLFLLTHPVDCPPPSSLFSPHSSTQVGIENLSVRFPQSNYSGHLQEDGYNWLVIGCAHAHGCA